MSTVSSDIRAYFAQSTAHDFLIEQGIPTECSDVDLFVYRKAIDEFLFPVLGVVVEFKPRNEKGKLKFPTEKMCYLKACRKKNEEVFNTMQDMRHAMTYSTRDGSIVLFFTLVDFGAPTKDVTKNYTPEEKKRYEDLEQFVKDMNDVKWRSD